MQHQPYELQQLFNDFSAAGLKPVFLSIYDLIEVIFGKHDS